MKTSFGSRVDRFVSDRRKVMAAALVLTVLTVAAIGSVTVRTTHDRLFSRTDATLHSQLTAAQNAVKLLSPSQLQRLSHVQGVMPGEIVGAVVDSHGRVVWEAPTPAGRARPAATDVARVAHSSDPFTVRAPDGAAYRGLAGPIAPGARLVYLTSLAGVDQTLHDLTVTIVLLGGIGAVLLALLLWRLLAAASRPVDSMIEVAAQIGRGDLSARIDAEDLRGEAGRLARALNQMVDRLDREAGAKAAADARLRQFVADASHELRSPLANIRGYAQLIRIGASDDPTIAVRRIEDETIRMSALVDDLLLLARFDQGRVSPRAPLDLVELVRDVVADARVIEPARSIELRTIADAVAVLGNAEELRRVFINLLANVRVHTPADAPCTVVVDITPGTAFVSVSDRGPGMMSEDAAKAFDRFFRSDASRTRDSGGSGLGLSISQAVVTAHGGSIGLTSTSGTGTTALVALPRVAVTPEPEPDVQAESETPATATGAATQRQL
ncbi:MAG TPA: HAMP domain-containing sensor histidine kinase [Acidimicrobiia bacterium]